MAIDIQRLNPAQLNDLIERARERQEQVGRERLAQVRERLVAVARAEGFTVAELFGASKSNKAKGKVAPKYRNPADGTTWSGRGPRPRWFVAALKKGKKEKDLLI